MTFTLQLKRAVLAGIRLYQLTLSPWLGRQCRFHPTCSCYAQEAIETHGVLRGGLLALRRLGRCHPFHAGGVDLVPARIEVRKNARTEVRKNARIEVSEKVRAGARQKES